MTKKPFGWLLLPVVLCASTAYAQDVHLLCEVVAGSGGSAGAGGSGGSGGAAGSGGVSGAGSGGMGGAGSGGGGSGGGGVSISSPLTLDKNTVEVGQTLAGTVTLRNNGTSPVTFGQIIIATRGPGATNSGGPFDDMSPTISNRTVQPGGSVTLSATRTYGGGNPVGSWRAYVAYSIGGVFTDGPDVPFTLAPASGGGGTGGGGSTPPPQLGFSAGTQSWYIASWSGMDIYKDNVNWSTAYSSGTDIWNPVFISALQGYSTFRHMDSNATNFSKISSWSQRKLPTDPGNEEIYIDSGSSSNTTGLAVEWQIDLCNRANVDCWFTLPYLADDNYVREQAKLIQAKLNPNLRVYWELSNEVWNGSFSAFNQSIQAGQAGGLPGSNQYYQGIAHEMYRALQHFQIVQDVFGVQAMGQRIIRVFAESGNLDLTSEALRNVYTSNQWNPRGQKIDMIALAPYIGSGTNGSSETLSRWKTEVDQKVNGEPIQQAVSNHTTPYNIPLLGCYEAGMHHLNNAHVWAANPQVYDAYLYMLTRFGTKMNAVCNQYTIAGTWSSGGAWGAYDHIGQSTAQAHKARAINDFNSGTRFVETDVITIVLLILVVLAFLALLYFWLWQENI